ncbi:hypothetical protein DSM112329_05461 [Paraconexibacter sp. AEG42_29]|uniref:Uncharacterized protein n=1 Tax=Paraconexibacter sp. AEG42_29 TaxID=2997339 RepID=A0AAU7B4I4_9ACTN
MKRSVAAAVAIALVVGIGGPAAGGASGARTGGCGGDGLTRVTDQGVRLYSTSKKVKGKTRVTLLACSTARRTPQVLAAGPPSLVAFGAFRTTGKYVGFEVTGVQSASGVAGAGTNYNIGWVDARTGKVQKNFLFVRPIRPSHRYVIDPGSGSLATIIGKQGSAQALYVAAYRKAFANGFGSSRYGDWKLAYDERRGTVIPSSVAFDDGIVGYRTTAGATVQVDPATGKEVAAG